MVQWGGRQGMCLWRGVWVPSIKSVRIHTTNNNNKPVPSLLFRCRWSILVDRQDPSDSNKHCLCSSDIPKCGMMVGKSSAVGAHSRFPCQEHKHYLRFESVKVKWCIDLTTFSRMLPCHPECQSAEHDWQLLMSPPLVQCHPILVRLYAWDRNTNQVRTRCVPLLKKIAWSSSRHAM